MTHNNWQCDCYPRVRDSRDKGVCFARVDGGHVKQEAPDPRSQPGEDWDPTSQGEGSATIGSHSGAEERWGRTPGREQALLICKRACEPDSWSDTVRFGQHGPEYGCSCTRTSPRDERQIGGISLGDFPGVAGASKSSTMQRHEFDRLPEFQASSMTTAP